MSEPVKFAPLNLTREELIEYTPDWKGERFENGRPRVPDDILERMRRVSITQAWGVLNGQGFKNQFEDGWMCTQPSGTLVGRALTASIFLTIPWCMPDGPWSEHPGFCLQ